MKSNSGAKLGILLNDLVTWKTVTSALKSLFTCSILPINQAHLKAILDVTVAKPLLYIKEAFYGSTV